MKDYKNAKDNIRRVLVNCTFHILTERPITPGFGQVGQTRGISAVYKSGHQFRQTNKAGHRNESMNF
jgi:hypothetical protein